eukprot:50511-Eustigmatos_ZCMA.PRE.1
MPQLRQLTKRMTLKGQGSQVTSDPDEAGDTLQKQYASCVAGCRQPTRSSHLRVRQGDRVIIVGPSK